MTHLPNAKIAVKSYKRNASTALNTNSLCTVSGENWQKMVQHPSSVINMPIPKYRNNARTAVRSKKFHLRKDMGMAIIIDICAKSVSTNTASKWLTAMLRIVAQRWGLSPSSKAAPHSMRRTKDSFASNATCLLRSWSTTKKFSLETSSSHKSFIQQSKTYKSSTKSKCWKKPLIALTWTSSKSCTIGSIKWKKFRSQKLKSAKCVYMSGNTLS